MSAPLSLCVLDSERCSTTESPLSTRRDLADFEVEIKRIRRKVDLFVVPTVAVLYMCCFINRTNIGNARLAGLEDDLGMSGADYNMLLSVFYIPYILFEIPSNMACRWIGPGWYLSALALGFGLATVSFAFVHSLGAACAVRVMLGTFEAGVLPGIAYHLSRWYTRSELVFRLAMYIVMSPLAGAFGGLLASAIFRLPPVGSLTGWRTLFLVEGVATVGLAVLSFFTLTDQPNTASWLSKADLQLLLDHLNEGINNSAHTGHSVSRQHHDLHRHQIWQGVWNPVVLTTAVVLLLINITVQGVAFFLPTVVRTIYPHQTLVQQQLLTAPPYLFGVAAVLLTCYGSYRWNRRNVVMTVGAGVAALGYTTFLATRDGTARYVATFIVIAGSYSFGALAQAQSAANVDSDTARMVALATTVTCGNVGGLIATWSFIPSDGPDYHLGNGLNTATTLCIVAITLALEWWMAVDNQRRSASRCPPRTGSVTSRNSLRRHEWDDPTFRWRP